MGAEIYLIGIGYIVAAFTIAFYARNKKIGFVRTFLFSIILTPIVGGILSASSAKNIIYHVKQYKCPECGYSFTERHPKCPFCAKDGKIIRLEERIREMT